MAKYVKSHSNYVLRRKHQDINDGSIYERDAFTVGGVNQYAKGQTPIFNDGNFIITVNNEIPKGKNTSLEKWATNGDGEVWNLSNTPDSVVSSSDTSSSSSIVIKNDYYSIKDFAYYGSCSELIRTSINDIVEKFPAEMYVHNNDDGGSVVSYQDGTGQSKFIGENEIDVTSGVGSLYGDDYEVSFSAKTDTYVKPIKHDDNGMYVENTSDGIVSKDYLILTSGTLEEEGITYAYYEIGKEEAYVIGYFKDGIYDVDVSVENDAPILKLQYSKALFLLYNPFSINIHKVYASPDEIENELRYFCNEGYKNYCVINASGTSSQVNYWSVKYTGKECVGDCFAIITVNEYSIYAFYGNEKNVYYMVDEEVASLSIHIRPNSSYLDKFFNNIPVFERVLLNRNSTPIYTSNFEMVGENEDGLYYYTSSFTFPVDDGGYNIDVQSQMYYSYIESLSSNAAYYDENFCDNLYRSMTHESIKTFDYTSGYGNNDSSDYSEGGERISNFIRIFGREMDEIKAYIDNISSANMVTYDDMGNTPNYFMTDLVEEEGWDYISVVPKSLSEYVESGSTKYDREVSSVSGNFGKIFRYNGNKGLSESVPYYLMMSSVSEQDNQCVDENNSEKYDIVRKFYEDASLSTYPYTSEGNDFPNGYFLLCNCQDGTSDKKIAADEDYYTDKDCYGNSIIKKRIKQYFSEKKYDTSDLNNLFLKELKLNSRYISRRKGTEDGIEMMLSLFGMKSKRWAKSVSSYKQNNTVYSGGTYDYDIKEYTTVTNGIFDPYDSALGNTRIDWINSTKLIDYDTESYKLGNYITYQGLPVIYKEKYGEDGELEGNKMYPYYGKEDVHDGSTYYQMKGGWMQKIPFSFDNDDNIFSGKTYSVDSSERISSDNGVFKETIKDINTTDTIASLSFVDPSILSDGSVYYVSDLSADYAIIDGIPYEIKTRYATKEENSIANTSEGTLKYISVVYDGAMLRVGNTYFSSYVCVTSEDDTDDRYDFDSLEAGRIINIYIKNYDTANPTIKVYEGNNSISNFYLFKNGKIADTNINGSNYFRLYSVDHSDEIGMEGWQQIAIDSEDYHLLNSRINYFNGNNPHTGNFSYDNGYEYMEYFSKLFKYPLENDMFDEREYASYSDFSNNVISNIGFKGINYDSDECTKEYNLEEDSKIHFFGNYYPEDGEEVSKYEVGYSLKSVPKKSTSIMTEISDENISDSYYNAINKEYAEIEPYNFSGLSESALVSNYPIYKAVKGTINGDGTITYEDETHDVVSYDGKYYIYNVTLPIYSSISDNKETFAFVVNDETYSATTTETVYVGEDKYDIYKNSDGLHYIDYVYDEVESGIKTIGTPTAEGKVSYREEKIFDVGSSDNYSEYFLSALTEITIDGNIYVKNESGEWTFGSEKLYPNEYGFLQIYDNSVEEAIKQAKNEKENRKIYRSDQDISENNSGTCLTYSYLYDYKGVNMDAKLSMTDIDSNGKIHPYDIVEIPMTSYEDYYVDYVKFFYEADIEDPIKSQSVRSGNAVYFSGSSVDNETYQIMNNKRVDLIFNLKYDLDYSKKSLEEIKYLDSVVSNYVSQVIPPNVILSVIYKKNEI